LDIGGDFKQTQRTILSGTSEARCNGEAAKHRGPKNEAPPDHWLEPRARHIQSLGGPRAKKPVFRSGSLAFTCDKVQWKAEQAVTKAAAPPNAGMATV